MHQGLDLSHTVNVNNVKTEVTLYGRLNKTEGARQANEKLKLVENNRLTARSPFL